MWIIIFYPCYRQIINIYCLRMYSSDVSVSCSLIEISFWNYFQNMWSKWAIAMNLILIIIKLNSVKELCFPISSFWEMKFSKILLLTKSVFLVEILREMGGGEQKMIWPEKWTSHITFSFQISLICILSIIYNKEVEIICILFFKQRKSTNFQIWQHGKFDTKKHQNMIKLSYINTYL